MELYGEDVCMLVCMCFYVYVCMYVVCVCVCVCKRIQSLVRQEDKQKGLSLSCTGSRLCFSGNTEATCLLLLTVLRAQNPRPNLRVLLRYLESHI